MMRFALFRSILALSLAGLLAACGGNASDSTGADGTADGEVLEGSISDAMIPLDQLKSQGRALENAPSDGNQPSPDAAPAATDEAASTEDAPAAEATPDADSAASAD